MRNLDLIWEISVNTVFQESRLHRMFLHAEMIQFTAPPELEAPDL